MSNTNDRERQLTALENLRKVFLVAQKAFDVADIIGAPDERRAAMRALHNEAIALTNNLSSVGDLDAVRVDLERLLTEMANVASVEEVKFSSGGIVHTATTGEHVVMRKGPIAPLDILPLGTTMTTNDPQEKYEGSSSGVMSFACTDQFEKDENDTALLTDKELERGRYDDSQPIADRGLYVISPWTPKQIRDFYEAKITSGELMVVKTAQIVDGPGMNMTCSGCGKLYSGNDRPVAGEFCKCGAKITDA